MEKPDPKRRAELPEMLHHALLTMLVWIGLSLIYSLLLQHVLPYWFFVLVQINILWGTAAIHYAYNRHKIELVRHLQTMSVVLRFFVLACFWPVTIRILEQRAARSAEENSSAPGPGG